LTIDGLYAQHSLQRGMNIRNVENVDKDVNSNVLIQCATDHVGDKRNRIQTLKFINTLLVFGGRFIAEYVMAYGRPTQ